VPKKMSISEKLSNTTVSLSELKNWKRDFID
jgi:hypothetical protein